MNWIFSKVVPACMILGILAFPAFGGQIKYEVTAWNGYVAVRQRDSGKLSITDTRLSMLSPEDRCLLEEGILCENEQTLIETLENFCS